MENGYVYTTISSNAVNCSIAKQIVKGLPNYTLEGDLVLSPLQNGFLSVTYLSADYILQGTPTVLWSYNGPLTSLTGTAYLARYRAGNSSGYGSIYAGISNACGTVNKNVIYQVQNNFFMAYPNPVSETLTVVITDESIQSDINIEILDKNMIRIKILITNDKESNINIADLKKGIYFLHVSTNTRTQTKQIVKE